MDRRKFVKLSTATCGTAALLPKELHAQTQKSAAPAARSAQSAGASSQETVRHLLSKKKGVPKYAGNMKQSDMLGLGPDGKPDPNYKATGIGVTPAADKYDPSKPPHKMKLTKEEQNILDGKKGKALAKVMRTVVDHGNLFGATKLVKLGGAPHTSFFTGTPAMAPLVKAFTECADEGLKAYAPYTCQSLFFHVNRSEYVWPE